MQSPVTFHKFLNQYGQRCGLDVDIVLFSLLKQYKKEITPVFEQDYDRFHKMFRITDVVNTGVDNVIWHLMNESLLIWTIFEEYELQRTN